MDNSIKHREPCPIMSAVKLSQLPLTKMQKQIEDQENHYRKERGMGEKAKQALNLLRSGHELTVTRGTKRNSYSIDGQKFTHRVIAQLIHRGYLDELDVFPEGRNHEEN